MTEIISPEVKLICAVTFAPDADLDDVVNSLEGAFGLIDGRSGTIDFNHTDYYTEEMGSNLKKFLLSFEHPFRPIISGWLSEPRLILNRCT